MDSRLRVVKDRRLEHMYNRNAVKQELPEDCPQRHVEQWCYGFADQGAAQQLVV
jgi:hypothetical protein